MSWDTIHDLLFNYKLPLIVYLGLVCSFAMIVIGLVLSKRTPVKPERTLALRLSVTDEASRALAELDVLIEQLKVSYVDESITPALPELLPAWADALEEAEAKLDGE